MDEENDVESIHVLHGLEGIRRRPAMYIGGVDASGLAHLVDLAIRGATDLHLARAVTELRVALGLDGVTVSEDGPGISPDASDRIVRRLMSGSRFDIRIPEPHTSPTLHDVGLAVVNALSDRFEMTSSFEGRRWTRAFARGEPVSEIRDLGPTTADDTIIAFHPDPMIFGSSMLDVGAVERRLRDLAWLCPHLRVFFQGVRFDGRGGVRAWAVDLARERGPLDAVVSTQQIVDRIHIDLALAWAGNGAPDIRAFVNAASCASGTHVDGVWNALDDTLRAGLTCIVHVGLYDAMYTNAARDRIANPEVTDLVSRAVLDALDRVRTSDFVKHRSRR